MKKIQDSNIHRANQFITQKLVSFCLKLTNAQFFNNREKNQYSKKETF